MKLIEKSGFACGPCPLQPVRVLHGTDSGAKRAPEPLQGTRQFFNSGAPVIRPIRRTHALQPALVFELGPLVEIETRGKAVVEVVERRESGLADHGGTEIEQARGPG